MKKGERWVCHSWHGFERARVNGPEKRYQGLRLVPIVWETGKLAGRPALIEREQFGEKIDG